MKLGYLQEQVIKLGKEKGYVTSNDVRKYYSPKEINRQMAKLVALGFLKQAEDKITYILWRSKK